MSSANEVGVKQNKPGSCLHHVRRIARDERGVVMLEYTLLVGVVGISCAAAFVYLGVAMVKNFDFVRGMLLTPFP